MSWSVSPNFCKISIWLLCFFAIGWNCQAQSDSLITSIDSLVSDSVKEHSPKKAVMYSAILPGLGQAYNKKFWKIPIIYAGLGVTTYFALYNQSEFKRFKTAYLYRVDGDPTTIDEFEGIYTDESQLLSLTEYYRRNRDLLIIGTAGVYLLNIIDAAVDAHFYDFDVSTDLSLRVQPVCIPKTFNGLALTFRF